MSSREKGLAVSRPPLNPPTPPVAGSPPKMPPPAPAPLPTCLYNKLLFNIQFMTRGETPGGEGVGFSGGRETAKPPTGTAEAHAGMARPFDTPAWFPLDPPAHPPPPWTVAPQCEHPRCIRPIVSTLTGDQDTYRPLPAYDLPANMCPGHGMMAALTAAIDPDAPIGIGTDEAAHAVTYAHQALMHFELPAERYYVYRLHDAAGALLYVGYSNDVTRRLREHAKQQPWWPNVRGHAHEVFHSEAEARAAELHAIRTERPRYNIQGAARVTSGWPHQPPHVVASQPQRERNRP